MADEQVQDSEEARGARPEKATGQERAAEVQDRNAKRKADKEAGKARKESVVPEVEGGVAPPEDLITARREAHLKGVLPNEAEKKETDEQRKAREAREAQVSVNLGKGTDEAAPGGDPSAYDAQVEEEQQRLSALSAPMGFDVSGDKVTVEGADGPLGATVANQQPVTITGRKFVDPVPTTVTNATPVVGTDGGDGTRTSPVVKAADNVWSPFEPLHDTFAPAEVAPATRTQTTGDNCAVIAANPLTDF